VARQQMEYQGINLSSNLQSQFAIFMNRNIPGPADFPRFVVSSTSFALQPFEFLAAIVRFHGPVLLLLQFHPTRVLPYYRRRRPGNLGFCSASECRKLKFK
jgi:hypothetical protein